MCSYRSSIVRRYSATAIVGWIVSVALASSAVAQDVDVEFEVIDGAIVLSAGSVFSAQFLAPGPVPGPPPVEIDEPGFEASDGSLAPGATLSLRVVQPLHYWNGAAVANPAPLDTVLQIVAEGGEALTVDRRGIPTAGALQFAVASQEGAVHEHLVFRLPASTAPNGAYGLVMRLSSPGLVESPPFLAVFGQRITSTELANAEAALLVASGIADGALLSDFDLSDEVDGGDLTKWKAGFGTTGHALLADGDANRDGAVEGVDFLAWQREVGAEWPGGEGWPAGVVPEPATGALALAGMVAIWGVRPRRLV